LACSISLSVAALIPGFFAKSRMKGRDIPAGRDLLCAFSETIDDHRRDALAAQYGVFDLRKAQFQGVIFTSAASNRRSCSATRLLIDRSPGDD
jgi:hypothetical protein